MLPLLLVAVVASALLAFPPRKLILGIVALAPIVNLFWFVRIGGLTLIDLTIGGVFIVAILKIAARPRWRPGKFLVPFVVLCSALFYPVFQQFGRGEFLGAADFVFKVFVGFATYQVVVNCFRYEDRWRLVQCAVIAVVLTICVVGVQLVTGYGTNYSRYTYVTGFYSDEGTLTRIAVIGLAFLLPVRGVEILPRKWMAAPLLVMCLALLGLALSRNAVLAALAVVLVHFLLQRNLTTMTTVAAGVALLFFGSATIQSNYSNKLGKEIRYLQGEDIDPATLGSGRIGRWERALEEFDAADLTTQIFGSGRSIGPHGQVIDLLRRTGVYGIVVFAGFFAYVTAFVLKHRRKDPRDALPHYGVLLVAAFWTLCLAASPLYEFYWQVLIFAIVGLLEVKEMTPRLAAVPVALAQAPRAIEPARPGRAATRGEWRAAAGGGRRRGRG